MDAATPVTADLTADLVGRERPMWTVYMLAAEASVRVPAWALAMRARV